MTTANTRAQRLEAVLLHALAPSRLEVEDESARHAGHAGARAGGETHYKVTIVAECFKNKKRVERSRMVHGLLTQEFGTGLHALSLALRAPDEE